MTTVTIGELLETTDAALSQIRHRYEAIQLREPTSPRGRLAGILSQREANTIMAIDGYRTRDEHHNALDVNVRLGGGFPFCDAPHVTDDPSIAELIGVAEQTDRLLEYLRERVELYAAGAELHAAFDALDALIRRRRGQLASAAREIDDWDLHAPEADGAG